MEARKITSALTFRFLACGICVAGMSTVFAVTPPATASKEPDLVLNYATADFNPRTEQFQENWLVAIDYDTENLKPENGYFRGGIDASDGDQFTIDVSGSEERTSRNYVMTNLVTTVAPAKGRVYFSVPSLAGFTYHIFGAITSGSMLICPCFEVVAKIPNNVYAYAVRSYDDHSFDDTATWTVGGKPATHCPGEGDTIWYSGYSGLSIRRLVLPADRKVASISVEGDTVEPFEISGSSPFFNQVLETDSLVCHFGKDPMLYLVNCQLKVNWHVDDSFIIYADNTSSIALPAGAKIRIRNCTINRISVPDGCELSSSIDGNGDVVVTVSGKPPAEDGTVSSVTVAQTGEPVLKVQLGGSTKDLKLAGEWTNHLAGAEMSAAAFNAIGKNWIPVWQSYVLGVNPREEKPVSEQISATITIKSDGTPEVSCVPNVSQDANRKDFVTYETYGKATLDTSSEWEKLTDENRTGMRFFQIRASIK